MFSLCFWSSDFMSYPLAYDKTTYKWKLTGPMPEPVL